LELTATIDVGSHDDRNASPLENLRGPVPAVGAPSADCQENEMTQMSDATVSALRYLRRYARALTGSQERGDRYVRQFLEAVLSDRSLLPGTDDTKLEIFTVFHRVCAGLGPADLPGESLGLGSQIERQVAALSPIQRQILLLVSVEGFSPGNVGDILGISDDEARKLLLDARLHLQKQIGSRVLIIEDETVIAMDVAVTVRSAGHTVIGVADTVDKAVALAEQHRPDLVLADVQLKDGETSLAAVEKIQMAMGTPVIFVTGFPEALLNGEGVEPTFLVTKPFDPVVLTTMIGQALQTRPGGRKSAA
jgi:DNA-directed RNA polymerase specialized sigma24 family protein/CheY-like chemotaxis protein